MSAIAAALVVAVFVTTFWLTGRYRSYAVTHGVLDVPNGRSSHTRPVPRGGGVAIVAASLTALPLAAWIGGGDCSAVWGLTGAGAIAAIVGLTDDFYGVRPHLRLVGHFLAAIWLLAWLDGLPPVPLFDRVLDLGWVGHLLAVLYVVWLLNLTNFMDGIDGLAALEAVTVTGGIVVVYLFRAPGAMDWLLPAVLGAAALGFMVWNWHPARIFMGDTGSGFLGVMLAGMSLAAAVTDAVLLWSWIILLALFITDATLTLSRRVLRGDRFYEGHRSHAYQNAAQRWGHARVTQTVGLINVCWLLPIASAVGMERLDGETGLLLAFAPLVVLALRLQAGARLHTGR